MRNCRAYYLLIALPVLAILSGCQSVKQPLGTSEGYTTFRFIDVGPSGDERFEEPSAERDQITQAKIKEIFEGNGLTYDADNADLIVAYLYIRQNNVSTMVVPTYYGLGHQEIQDYVHKKGVLKGEQREYIDKGAIVIDVIDTDSQKLVYRNWAVRDIRNATDEDRKPLIEGVVSESLSAFFE